MKSKYFNISENKDGTFFVTTLKGRVIDTSAYMYEFNPKQPKFIKIRHDGGAWCSLFNERGCALKDTMWVNDVVLNDDGSYCVQEYMNDDKWTHYDNKIFSKHFLSLPAICLSAVLVSGAAIMISILCEEKNKQKNFDENFEMSDGGHIQKVYSSPVQVLPKQNEHIHE